MSYNKTTRKIHNYIFIACILVFGCLFVLHSALIYKSFAPLLFALFLVGVFVIQNLFYAITGLSFAIFGKLTGYKIIYLKIAFMKWQKDTNGKLRFSFAQGRGPASVCKVSPPEMKDGKMPYMLYGHGLVLLSAFLLLFQLLLLPFAFTRRLFQACFWFLFLFYLLLFYLTYTTEMQNTQETSKSPLLH